MEPNTKYLLDHLRCIPDFPKKGINFRDVTTLFKDAKALEIMEDMLYELYKDKGITKVVGLEAEAAQSVSRRFQPDDGNYFSDAILLCVNLF